MTVCLCIACGRDIGGNKAFQMWTYRDEGPYHLVCFNVAHPGEEPQDRTGIYCRTYALGHREWVIAARPDGVAYAWLQHAHDDAVRVYREMTGREPPEHGWLRITWTAAELMLSFTVREEVPDGAV